MLILFIKGFYGVIFSSYHLNEAYSRKNIVKYFQMVIREAKFSPLLTNIISKPNKK